MLGDCAALAVMDRAVAGLRLGLLELDRSFGLLGFLDLGNLGPESVEFLRLKRRTRVQILVPAKGFNLKS